MAIIMTHNSSKSILIIIVIIFGHHRGLLSTHMKGAFITPSHNNYDMSNLSDTRVFDTSE